MTGATAPGEICRLLPGSLPDRGPWGWVHLNASLGNPRSASALINSALSNNCTNRLTVSSAENVFSGEMAGKYGLCLADSRDQYGIVHNLRSQELE